MKEIVCVKLENDMDLILAHRRTMKLCELTGFSLIAQTSIATAVSEIARCAIEYGKTAELVLGIQTLARKKILKAIIRDKVNFSVRCAEATHYAKRLVDDIEIINSPKEVQIILKQQLIFSNTLSEAKIKSFEDYFKNEPPISPYDELRKKNLLLQDLAEKVQESENDYRELTDSLPLMMFSANNRGGITYMNKWLKDFFLEKPKDLTGASWKGLVHTDESSLLLKDINNAVIKQIRFTGQYRFLDRASGNYVWHLMSVIPVKNDREIITRWIGFIVDINAQKNIEQTLKDNRELKQTQKELFEHQAELQQKVLELNRSNYELEQFAHLASHDLQEPLRKLFFYSDMMKQKYSDRMDNGGINMLNSMAAAAGRMKELIHDLLSYSQLQQQKLTLEQVNLTELLHEIIRDLDLNIKEKSAVIEMDDLPVIQGNPLRLRQLFQNLFTNALKYSKQAVPPHIQISRNISDGKVSIKVRDNGIGFDEQYKEKIFGLFERLHSRDQFPGTGIGLSICKKIAELHHGTISAVSQPGEFSEFEVVLPLGEIKAVAS